VAVHDLARLARRAGIGVVVTHLMDGPVALAAARELALGLETPMACGLDDHEALLTFPRVKAPSRAREARIRVSREPGLGLDRAMLERVWSEA
jgi:L-alanine-DL-glutamate epimerase-like enolase superfamily enzyme